VSKRVTLNLFLHDETYRDLQATAAGHVADDARNGFPGVVTEHSWMQSVAGAWLDTYSALRKERDVRIAARQAEASEAEVPTP
jgi:hypothetical protein